MSASRWVIAYDLDVPAIRAAEEAGGPVLMTVYNRVRACVKEHGFTGFTQLSVYAMPDEDNALLKVYQALQALKALPEAAHIKRLHVFKIDGALNDVLPIVADRSSAGPE